MIFNSWMLSKLNKSRVDFISDQYKLDKYLAAILVNRGFDSLEDIQSLFDDENLELESPFKLADMQKSVDRIRIAIDNYEKIVIYGDYDCDGVTSTSMLYLYLESVGANISYYIPTRSGEGYGLNCEALDELKYDGVDLVITVDNGVSANKEADHALKLGIDLIITDHHQAGSILPKAYSLINPNRKDCPSEFKYLCGAGVAFKLIVALEDGDYELALENFSDILAIGTIGDIVPIVGENRYFVKRGLKLIKESNNIGLSSLLQTIHLDDKSEISSENIAFGVVPRINAAGRMKDAKMAVELFTSDDKEVALSISEDIEKLNLIRREQGEQIIVEIEECLSSNYKLLNNKVLVIVGEGWNHGIIGIVCSKMVEKYGKPTIILSLDQDEAVGSARSLGNFHLYNALDYCGDLLVRFGGHKLAAGMTIDRRNIDLFIDKINVYAAEQYEYMPTFTYNIDLELNVSSLNLEFLKKLDSLKPYGCDNEKPLFLTKNFKINKIYGMSENKHIKLYLSLGNQSFCGIMFNVNKDKFFYKPDDLVDVVYNIEQNEYNQKISLQILIKDIRHSGFNQKEFLSYKNIYENFKINSDLILPKEVKPSRNEIGQIYMYLKKNNGFDYNFEYLFYISKKFRINYCKFRIIIDILNELSLISINKELDKIIFIDSENKLDLNMSQTYKLII